MQSLLVPDTPGAVGSGAVSGIDQTRLGADFDETAAITLGGITPGVVPVTPGLWPASAVADVVGTLLGDSDHQPLTSDQVSSSDQASGSRKSSSVSIMTGGSKHKVGRPKLQSTPARSGPAIAEAMEFPDEGPWKSVNANPVPGASVFRPLNQQVDEMRDIVTPGLQIDTERLKSPMDFMKFFLTDELVQQHVDDTNVHAENIRSKGMKRRSRNCYGLLLSLPKCSSFFGIIFHMGILHLPKLSDYWRKSRGYAQDFYRVLMGRDTFMNILWFCFFGDEAADDENKAHLEMRKYFRLLTILT